MICILNITDTALNKEITWKIMHTQHCIKPHILYRHTHREDIADVVWVNTLHHSIGGYTGTSPSHPSSSASLYPAPPSNPPHNLSVQLESASHTQLLFPLFSPSFLQSWICVLSITSFPSSLFLYIFLSSSLSVFFLFPFFLNLFSILLI